MNDETTTPRTVIKFPAEATRGAWRGLAVAADDYEALERELATALRERENTETKYATQGKALDATCDELRKALRERDEARGTHGYSADYWWKAYEGQRKARIEDINDLRALLEAVTGERDEAQAYVRSRTIAMKEASQRADAATSELAEMEKERNARVRMNEIEKAAYTDARAKHWAERDALRTEVSALKAKLADAERKWREDFEVRTHLLAERDKAEAKLDVVRVAFRQIEDHHNETEGWREIAASALAALDGTAQTNKCLNCGGDGITYQQDIMDSPGWQVCKVCGGTAQGPSDTKGGGE